jgi:hypothetical protein
MDQAVSFLPEGRHWRVSAAWNIARMSMQLSETVIRALTESSDVSTVFTSSTEPNSRIQTISNVLGTVGFRSVRAKMLKWGADKSFLDAFSFGVTPESVTDRLRKRGQATDWDAAAEKFDFLLLHALLDLVETALPETNEAHDDSTRNTWYRLLNSFSPAADDGSSPYRKIDPKLLQYFADACNQRVRVYDSSVYPRSADDHWLGLTSFLHDSINRFGVINGFFFETIESKSDGHALLPHLLTVTVPDHVDHFSLRFEEFKHVLELGLPVVWVVEVDERHYPVEEHFGNLGPSHYAFVRLDENPIVWLHSQMTHNRRVSVAFVGLAYQRTITILLFWVDDSTIPYFVVGNEMICETVDQYVSQLRATEFIRRLAPADVVAKLPEHALRGFADHPILNYYLCGNTGTDAVHWLQNEAMKPNRKNNTDK